MTLRIRSLAACLLLSSLVAACGDDAPLPPPDVDGGALVDATIDATVDATTRDAGRADLGDCVDEDGDGRGAVSCGGDDCDDTDADRFPGNPEICDAAGHDEDCNDSTFGPDGDSDGFVSSLCCNGPDNCGTDCDDTLNTVNPGAAETCNANVDDDCNGFADAADGVCVPCPSGFTGLDGACVDNDECVMALCGVGFASCMNTPGSYACTCAVGFTAPMTAGTCTDVNECITGLPCGMLATACTNTIGSYACSCLSGYGAPPTGGACADIDECMAGCGTGELTCTNTVGSFACTCSAGYTAPASGGLCVDVNECAIGTPCGAGLGICANTTGSYACTCNSGYAALATGGTCSDINECTAGTDDCDRDPIACLNTIGTFTCACPASFTGAGRGASGCLLSDPSLLSLVPSAGALSPAFVGATTMYTLTLPLGTTSVRLTPTLSFPSRATVLVNGSLVASGTPSTAVTVGFAPTPVSVVVTTESGATRTYTVIVSRGNTYIKASNTNADDYFGFSVALSADGSTLAVGAAREASNATGIGGNQADNSASTAGAVYVFTRAGSAWSQ